MVVIPKKEALQKLRKLSQGKPISKQSGDKPIVA